MTITALPDHARVWVFGATERLTDTQRTALDAHLSTFIRSWAAHGSQLLAAHDIVLDRFLVIAVDESLRGASGCSIDAMTRRLGELERELDVKLLDGALVWYRGRSGDIVSCERSEFKNRSEQGEIDAATRVFDPTIQTLGALRGGEFERPAGESWHAGLLSSTEAAGPF
ncbi:MAG: hypothetical protein ACC682_00420 [Gemmatimonadota bacterium]